MTASRAIWRQFVAGLALLGPGACGGAAAGDCANAGVEGCACSPLGRCFEGLECVANICIDPAAPVMPLPTGGPDVTSTGAVDPGTTTAPATTEATDDTTSDTNVSATATTETPGVCGDGKVDPGEVCDDGNQVDDDACSNACQAASGPTFEFVDPMPTLILGTKAGLAFSDTCQGALRGLGGYEQQVDKYISQVSGECAIAKLVPGPGGHQLQLSNGATLPAHGAASGTIIKSVCGAGQVVVGMTGFEDGAGLSGLQLHCASLSVFPDTLDVQIGIGLPLGLVGGVGFGGLGDVFCSADRVAVGILGFVDDQSSSVIAVGLHCARPVGKK